jgi:hypothetical protein
VIRSTKPRESVAAGRGIFTCRFKTSYCRPVWLDGQGAGLCTGHFCSANCFRRLFCASDVRLSDVSGTLNSRPQSEHTPTAGTGPSHFVMRRLRVTGIAYGKRTRTKIWRLCQDRQSPRRHWRNPGIAFVDVVIIFHSNGEPLSRCPRFARAAGLR